MIMGIRWQDRVTNQEVLDRAGSTSIESMLLKSQMRWTGHVIRMDENRINRQVMYGELKDGARKQGRPKLKYKDTLKSNLKWSGIQPRQLEACASDRSGWRSLTYKATAAFDEDRRQRLAAARGKRHRAASTSIQNTDFQCLTCGRLCASSFGLRSHMRRHR